MPPEQQNARPRGTSGVVARFLVGTRPIAVYGVGLEQSSRYFVSRLDAKYWEFQMELAAPKEGEDICYSRVLFVRQALSQAEEHLFALIFAFLQAPHCPDLWLYQYKTEDLVELINKVERSEDFLSRVKLTENSWPAICKILWPGLPEDRYRLTALILSRMARHFVSPFGRDEYNSIKHGMRLDLGGQKISFAHGTPDKLPDQKEYITLADSMHGCRFWKFEKLHGKRQHLMAVRCFANWDFHYLGLLLAHATLLIGNMGLAFRKRFGIDCNDEFNFITGTHAYEERFKEDRGVVEGETRHALDVSMNELVDLEEIVKQYI